MEEESKDRSPAALDIVEQDKNTDVKDAVMQSHKVVIIIIIPVSYTHLTLPTKRIV